MVTSSLGPAVPMFKALSLDKDPIGCSVSGRLLWPGGGSG